MARNGGKNVSRAAFRAVWNRAVQFTLVPQEPVAPRTAAAATGPERMDDTMALERRALLLAVVAVCALLLAVGPVGPREPARDPGAIDAVAAAGTTGTTLEFIASTAQQPSPLVLIATVEVAASRRDRRRLQAPGRHGGGRRRGRQPAPRPVGRGRRGGAGTGRDHGRGGPHRLLRPDPIAQVDEQFARMVIEFDVLVGYVRY